MQYFMWNEIWDHSSFYRRKEVVQVWTWRWVSDEFLSVWVNYPFNLIYWSNFLLKVSQENFPPVSQTVHPRNPPLVPTTWPRLLLLTWWAWYTTLVALWMSYIQNEKWIYMMWKVSLRTICKSEPKALFPSLPIQLYRDNGSDSQKWYLENCLNVFLFKQWKSMFI